MPELVPSNAEVQQRAESLEVRLRRVVALVAAVSGLSSLLPAAIPETSDIQTLLGILDEVAPAALQDLEWLINSHRRRTCQIDSILLKSVA